MRLFEDVLSISGLLGTFDGREVSDVLGLGRDRDGEGETRAREGFWSASLDSGTVSWDAAAVSGLDSSLAVSTRDSACSSSFLASSDVASACVSVIFASSISPSSTSVFPVPGALAPPLTLERISLSELSVQLGSSYGRSTHLVAAAGLNSAAVALSGLGVVDRGRGVLDFPAGMDSFLGVLASI